MKSPPDKKVTIASFQTEDDWVQVLISWDKQRDTDIVRKSTPSLQNSQGWCKLGQY